MRRGSLVCVLLLALAGCPGGGAGLGERCTDHGDCQSALQCVASTCVARCQRAPECGDGYACDKSGLCQPATGVSGDSCVSEVDCEAGLACEIAGTDTDPHTGRLVATCVPEQGGRPAGDTCTTDGDCRNGTCALGHCVDLCNQTLDCGIGTSCSLIPRVEAQGSMFAGCLQTRGTLAWSIPIHGPAESVLLPIPDTARSVAVTFSVEDPNQKVGATRVVSPGGTTLVDYFGSDYYSTPVRHRPDFAESTLLMPSSPATPLEAGAYQMQVTSLRSGDLAGTATPTANAIIKLDTSVILDLHFYFLNFDEHPCAAAFDGGLDAAIAQTAPFFQTDYLGELRSVFGLGGIALGTLTYEDLRDHPDLDGLDVANAPALLALGAHKVGINVFFVRTLSPVGLQAFGPNPGPAGVGSSPQSGVIIGLDTLCYRSWPQVARLTAHELARYMGLYDNIELDQHVDPIDDSDYTSTNLMFYSELGGTDLSVGQRDILGRSPTLR